MDRHTRLVQLKFTVYNPAVDLWSVVKFRFEIFASGGVRPRYQMRILNPYRHLLPLAGPEVAEQFPMSPFGDPLLCVFEVLLLFSVFLQLLVEFDELRTKGCWKYFAHFAKVRDTARAIAPMPSTSTVDLSGCPLIPHGVLTVIETGCVFAKWSCPAVEQLVDLLFCVADIRWCEHCHSYLCDEL